MSSMIDSGGPAFPRTRYHSDEHPIGYETGMTLRDYFAAKALTGMLSNSNLSAIPNEEIAGEAYAIADAMLEARENE